MDPNYRRKRSSELFELYDNETIYSRAKRYVEEPKFDVFLNPSKREKQEETLKNLTKKFQNVFSSMDMQGSYPALFQVILDIRTSTTSFLKMQQFNDVLITMTIDTVQWFGDQVSCFFSYTL